MTTTMTKTLLGTIAILVGTLAFPASAHDTGHGTPGTLPPIGPHGGSYARLTRHFAEIVVRGSQVSVYILENDVRSVAPDATKVTATLEVPGGRTAVLKLTKQKAGKGYDAPVSIPRTARRVYFHITCYLDGKLEKGKILYEPRR